MKQCEEIYRRYQELIKSNRRKAVTTELSTRGVKNIIYSVDNFGDSTLDVYLQTRSEGDIYRGLLCKKRVGPNRKIIITSEFLNDICRLLIYSRNGVSINCYVNCLGISVKKDCKVHTIVCNPIKVENTVKVKGTVNVGNTVEVTATDFDIRPLSINTDSLSVIGTVNLGNTAIVEGTINVGNIVEVTAMDFDIRPLSSSTDSVTVMGTVNIGNIIPIGVTVNLENTINVEGTVNIGNTVTVTASNFDIRALDYTVDSILSLNSFTSIYTIVNGVTSSGTVLNVDTSIYKEYSYYIKNTSSASVLARLQISPSIVESYYMNDGSSEIILGPGEKDVLVAQLYLQYARVYYDASISGGPVDIEIYFNGQL